MPEGDRARPAAPRRTGRLLRRSTGGLVVVVLVLAGASYWFDLGPRWFGFDYPSPLTEPAQVPVPVGLDLPCAGSADPVAEPAPAPAVAPRAVRRALSTLVRDKRFGSRLAVEVTDLSRKGNGSVFTRGAEMFTPASTMKLLTTTAALATLGPERRFSTTVVTGRRPGSIVLVGGGDPLLTRFPDPDPNAYPLRADLRTLATATAEELRDRGRTRVRLGYDTSLFTGPAVSPDWPASYLREEVVSRISPLWVDEGREGDELSQRSPDPAMAAARVFRTELGRRRVRVVGRLAPVTAPDGADRLARVQGAPLAQVVEHVLETSDNEAAEVLARQTAIRAGRPASFRGGAAAVRAALAEVGVDTSGDRILDGSGLSRDNRLSLSTLTDVLRTASGPGADIRPVVASLPVAGFSGSLAYRFTTGDPDGLGTVRAKTGTLTGVHGLAGVVTTKDGAVLTWVAVADRVEPADSLTVRNLLDRIGAALAGCVCAADR